ncbi:hypothetical protein [Segatella salivae]|jgi:lipoprotein|uniref:hypothetical protein n=1 Tax=Segatella salivae TaxID=228604 RepID=UPI001CB5CD8B|nr:hypothetical protein [Segatella salivae]MBF1556769.1 hypothetical protein [Segatella salivae]
MKLLFKVFVATAIIIVATFSFSSCNKDNGYISQEIPTPNKRTFIVTASDKEDTLYMKYTPYFRITQIHIKKGNTNIATSYTDNKNTEIKAENNVIGIIEYKDGEVYKITMNDWCTITKEESGKHKKAYLIKGLGAKTYPYTIDLVFFGREAPNGVEIK